MSNTPSSAATPTPVAARPAASAQPAASATSGSSAATAHSASYALVGALLGIGGVMLFSLRPGLIKYAYAYVTDPVTLLALRMGFSLPFFIAIAWWIARTQPARPLSARDWWDIAFLGFIAYYAASFLDFLGLQYVSASVGRLIMFLYPTVVVLLSWLWMKRPPGRRQLVALAVSYLGIVLVFYERLDSQHASFFLGAALVFAAALSYAIYLVMGTEVIKRVGSLRFTAYSMIIASLICLLQFLALRPLGALELPMPVYWSAIIMAVGSTVIPIFMTSEALKRVGANRFAVMGMLGPITTIVFGYIGLEEQLTLLQCVGAVGVMIGVLIVTLKPRSA